jgi:hypothetical protein
MTTRHSLTANTRPAITAAVFTRAAITAAVFTRAAITAAVFTRAAITAAVFTRAAITIAVITIVTAPPAQAATTDPELVLYRAPGVLDSGGSAGNGSATVFQCANFSGSTERIRIVVRFGPQVQIVSNMAFDIAHLQTISAVTHATRSFPNDVVLNTGQVNQGTAAIAATSPSIVCTAMTMVQGPGTAPGMLPVHMIRFTPAPASQE